MKLVNASIALLSIAAFIPGPAHAAYTPGSTTEGRVSAITLHTNKTYASIGGSWVCQGGSGGCSIPDCNSVPTSDRAKEVVINLAPTSNGQQLLSALTAAQLAGRNVILWVDGCYNMGWGSYPVVTAIQVR
jgi:hypothetical protein